jgi:hypothetical protein
MGAKNRKTQKRVDLLEMSDVGKGGGYRKT